MKMPWTKSAAVVGILGVAVVTGHAEEVAAARDCRQTVEYIDAHDPSATREELGDPGCDTLTVIDFGPIHR